MNKEEKSETVKRLEGEVELAKIEKKKNALRDIAFIMDSNEMDDELKDIDEKGLKELGIVVVFGYSDDNVEFRGAINEEVGAGRETSIYLNKNGLIENQCDDSRCPYYALEKSKAVELKVLWDKEGYSWVYEAPFHHETFDIMEDGEKYCRGIVFLLEDVEKVSK